MLTPESWSLLSQMSQHRHKHMQTNSKLQTTLIFHTDDNMQIETASQIPNTTFTTNSKPTATHANKTTRQEKAKLKATPHTKSTLQRNPCPIKNNNPNTQVNRLPKGSAYPIKLRNTFGSLDTMDVDLDPSYDKQAKNKQHLHLVKSWVFCYSGIVWI